MALEGKVKVPGLGEVDKKYAVGGVVVAVGIVGIVIIRKKSATNAAAGTASQPATDANATDPAGNVGVIDPSTGYVYGSPEDEQALSQGSTAAYSDLGYSGGDSGIDPATGIPYVDETGTGTTTTTTTTTPVATRETWLEQAISDMNAPSLATIAPAVWAGIAVSAADKATFLEAVALEGPPPGGYPTPIKLTDTTGQPAPTASVTVPKVTGERNEIAKPIIVSYGFKYTESPSGAAQQKGKEYLVASQSPAGGSKAAKGSTVHLTLRVK